MRIHEPHSPRRWLPFICVACLALAVPGAGFMSRERKQHLRQLARETWYHAFDAYSRIGFPLDEIRPLSCTPVGYDHSDPTNTEVNDVSGDFALTLVDSLDGLAVLGDRARFEDGVRKVIEVVHFERDIKVQVFEVNIRMLGGLLSAHQLAIDPKRPFHLSWYNNELLHLAHDLGKRLLPAFNATATGLPYARVNLQRGVARSENPETCAAGAGSLILEFALLSRLTGDPSFEVAARRAFFAVWNRRSDLNLLGNTLDVQSGQWRWPVSSTGAGLDSFFEYAAKAYVILAEDEWWRVWEESYAALLKHVRTTDGFWFRGVNMNTGQPATVVVDSLSAFLPAVQTLAGDLEGAIKAHAVYGFQWLRYGGLPEMYDITARRAVHKGYPLRPELIESNLYLYQATRDEWYLELAERFLLDIVARTKVHCGLAALLDVETGERENKMPSFVTAETLKYLYLTFDEHNIFNSDDSNAVWTTEGHYLTIEHPPPSAAKARRGRLTRLETGTCEAHDPLAGEFTLHSLELGVRRRSDMEYARYLAGYEPLDEGREVREGRWAPWGWCDAPPTEDYDVQILFAPDASSEMLDPPKDQLLQTPDGGITVGRILGLRFSLSKPGQGSAYAEPLGAGVQPQRVISRVGPYRLPRGALVTFTDPAVAASVPPPRPVHVELTLSLPHRELARKKDTGGLAGLSIPGIAASFGPPLTGHDPIRLAQPLAEDALGCVPYLDPVDGGPDGLPHPSLGGAVVLVERGECTFAQKAHIAHLAGARGVVVVNTDPEDQLNPLPPSADPEDERAFGAELAPLVMVSQDVGELLGEYLETVVGRSREGELRVAVDRPRSEREAQPGAEPLVLGGYVILNARIDRGGL